MADAGYRLVVEGEKEFKKALAEINAAVKENKSEFKLLSAEYENTDDKLGNLTKKQETLGAAVELQSKKAQIAEERYKAWAAQLGESDTAVLKLKESMNLAKTEFEKTKTELQKTSDAIQAFERGTDDTEGTVKRLDAVLAANRSEMKLVEAQYKDVADQSIKLQKQNALLEDSVELQKQKIEKLTAALNQAEKEYGEGSEAVSGYRKELADAQVELVDMEDQIGRNNEALEGSAESAEPLKNALVEVADKLGIDIPPGIENMSVGFVGAAAAAGGIVIAIKKGFESMKEMAAYADDVLTESIISGIDTTTYQQLKYMEGLMDVNTETFTSSLARIKRAMDDAAGGNDALAERFDRLGVSVTDANGDLRDSWDVFLETIDALGDMANETERDATAMDLMGKSAGDLNPLIEAGADRMRELADEAERVGYVINEEGLDKSGAFQDKLDRIQALADAAKNNVGLLLIETINLGNGNATLEDVQAAWDRVKASVKGTVDAITEDNQRLQNASEKWNNFWGQVFNPEKFMGLGGQKDKPAATSYRDMMQEIQDAAEETTESLSEFTEKRIAQIEEMYESELQTISESVESRQELLEEANKKELEDYREAQEDKLDAFENAQSKELKAYQKAQSQRKKEFDAALKAEMDALDASHREKLAQINEEYTERIKLVDEDRYKALQAIEGMIEDLDKLTAAEEKAEEERRKRESIAAAEEAIARAETAEEREQAEKEYSDLLAEYERERVLEAREAERKRLENMLLSVNEEYDRRVEVIEKEITEREKQAESEYDIAKAALEEEQTLRKEAFSELLSNELDAFRENQAAQKDAFKESLDQQVKDHEVYLSDKLEREMKELEDEIAAEEKAAIRKRDIRIKYEQESISTMERLNDDYVRDLNKTLTDNLPFLDRKIDLSDLPKIPRYASGTLHHPGGLALVGERGPELVSLPAGAAVYPNEVLRQASGTVVNNWYVSIPAKDVKEFNDIVRIAEQKRTDIRMGYTGG